jgi:hypothetical protein
MPIFLANQSLIIRLPTADFSAGGRRLTGTEKRLSENICEYRLNL